MHLFNVFGVATNARLFLVQPEHMKLVVILDRVYLDTEIQYYVLYLILCGLQVSNLLSFISIIRRRNSSVHYITAQDIC